MSYSNFNGLYKSTPFNYFKPNTIEELIDDIRKSSQPIRPIGSVHTFNDISMTNSNGTIIDTSRLNNIISINQTDKTVTTQSGVKLKNLLRYLQNYNITLPVMTATNNISIVGGISTGAHGSNINNGSLSSLLLSAEIIKANGEYEHVKGNDIYALGCSLGCLGVIYSVTLQCIDQFSIKEYMSNMPWHHVSEILDTILEKYPYTEMNIEQFSDNLNVNLTLREKISFDPSLGPGYKILTNDINSWYIEIELAFPYEIASTAVKAVASFHRQYKNKYNISTSSPLLVRFSAADHALISMASGRKTVYISSFFGREYSPIDVNEFMWKLCNEMVEKYKARPHYGKQHNLNKIQMKQIYGEEYDIFKSIIKKYDPERKFTNDYIKRIFPIITY